MIMRQIDEVYTEYPFFGRRRIHVMVNYRLMPERIHVNVKRISRLMEIMGIEAIYPKKNMSKPGKEAVKYPYLLRNIKPDHPNHVWATDITYIRMKSGFIYLVAIIDWYSRCILSWELSNTMDVGFRINALNSALEKNGKPEIFNSDQGSQFTSQEFTGILIKDGIRISHDGYKRALDNVIIERFWRYLKGEEIYTKDYQTVDEAAQHISSYISFYNHIRPHQSLSYITPYSVYNKK
jgi:putative transposase